MTFSTLQGLKNLGASGLNGIEKGCKAYGDTSNITSGTLGEKLYGDISGLSGRISPNLHGDATGIKLCVTGKTGDIRKALRDSEDLDRTLTLVRRPA